MLQSHQTVVIWALCGARAPRSLKICKEEGRGQVRRQKQGSLCVVAVLSDRITHFRQNSWPAGLPEKSNGRGMGGSVCSLFLCRSFLCHFRPIPKKRRQAKKWGQKNLRPSCFCPHFFAFPFAFGQPLRETFFIRGIRAIRGHIPLVAACCAVPSRLCVESSCLAGPFGAAGGGVAARCR